MRIRSYACAVVGIPGIGYYSAPTRGHAKYSFWKEVRFRYPEVKYTDVRCRVHGEPLDEGVSDVCVKRRLEPFKAGAPVMVGEDHGVILRANSSMNLDILFTEGPHEGLTLNCHPCSQMTILAVFEKAYSGETGNQEREL